tara:strand:- start:1917 stop:2795 length:879 start_codon:yes stop_codon:yes gene_type:complete
MDRKGIILAGGSGTRLYPITQGISKQLLPIYDKPTIYYPLTTLMQAGIREVLIITTKKDIEVFKILLGNGKKFGMEFFYEIQKNPDGLAQAFIIGEDYLGNSNAALILGDNIFHGDALIDKLKHSNAKKNGATIFACRVSDPKRYGVVEFSKNGKVLNIEEKPKSPKSNYAVTGLYFYDNSVIKLAKTIKPSKRNELEITDLNKLYLKRDNLYVEFMKRGEAWLDTGTYDSLHEASAYIRTLELRQGQKVGCPEETAWRQGWITDEELEELASPLKKSGYGNYLMSLLNEIN